MTEDSRRTVPVRTHFRNGKWTIEIDGKFFRHDKGNGPKQEFPSEAAAEEEAGKVWLESPNW